MTTIKIALRSRADKDGTHPLVMRISKWGKTHACNIGQSLLKKHWSETRNLAKPSHPNSASFNHFITQTLANAGEIVLAAEKKNKKVTSIELMEMVTIALFSEGNPEAEPKTEIIPESLRTLDEKSNIERTLFFRSAKQHLANLVLKGAANQKDKSRVKYFRKFMKYRDIPLDELERIFLADGDAPVDERIPDLPEDFDIPFADISPNLLRRFEIYLRRVRGVTDRTIANYMMMVQAVFKLAVDEGIIPEELTPFGRGKYKIFVPDSDEMGISVEDLKELESVELLTEAQQRAHDAWFLAFYLGGMRIGDVLRLKWSDFYDGHLHYRMGKNKKPGSVIIIPKVIDILARYEDGKRFDDDYVLPDLKPFHGSKNLYRLNQQIESSTQNYRRTMNERILPRTSIKRKVNPHDARRTIGDIAADKVSTLEAQKLLRHSSLSTTQKYMRRRARKAADAALLAVLNY